MLELAVQGADAATRNPGDSIVLREVDLAETTKIPQSTLVIVTETENLREDAASKDGATSLLPMLSDFDISFSKLKVRDWDGSKFYSDFIKEGLEYNNKDVDKVIMLFESPSSISAGGNAFHNNAKFKFHDWPPPKSTKVKAMLGPCRYALMNGASFPVFLREGAPPEGLLHHWAKAVPGFVEPSFASKVTEDDTVYAYLPVEQIKNHVNDPMVHYHLAGKDSIVLMTQKTTKLLPDTRTSRPCVVKTTHSMGSKGIFIIRNDDDEAKFEKYLIESGNPTFVVTDFVDIARNVACHFFMHPNGTSVTWFGSNENKRLPDGTFSSDSFLDSNDQENLKKMQLPFVEEVVQYCHSLGFWGFCGIDVLFDSKGRGYLVDINPRVTGSCPALMTLNRFRQHFGFKVGLFRRSGNINFAGSSAELFEKVEAFNEANEGRCRVVIHSVVQPDDKNDGPATCRINIGVYGNDMEECKTVLNRFANPKP